MVPGAVRISENADNGIAEGVLLKQAPEAIGAPSC
jgi:hypothetical protein